jgi:penicillin-binding protein 1A
MNAILIKIFATALAFSQAASTTSSIDTGFDRAKDQTKVVKDQTKVVELLRGGCTHVIKVFEAEDIYLHDLIATAMDDPSAVAGQVSAFRGLDFGELFAAYRQFCGKENVEPPAVDVAEIIDFYNDAMVDLPDPARLKNLKLPGITTVLSRTGERFSEIYEPDNRRIWVALSDIPQNVRRAFIAAEDKRFYEHRGIDERGLIRAFVGNLARSGRPQGGSTITQQVVKNLLVGDDPSYRRKIREIVLASRLEQTLSKDEILEIYLNSIYLGRNSWGVELAARSYFGKSARDLSLREAALLGGLTKGPSSFGPDRDPARARERMAYVLARMQEDGDVDAAAEVGDTSLPHLVAFERLRRDTGFYFVDQISREAKKVAGLDKLTGDSLTIRSTIDPQLQRATETALQDGLAPLRDGQRPRQISRSRSEPRRCGPASTGSRRAGPLARGARQCAPAALRRALDARNRAQH